MAFTSIEAELDLQRPGSLVRKSLEVAVAIHENRRVAAQMQATYEAKRAQLKAFMKMLAELREESYDELLQVLEQHYGVKKGEAAEDKLSEFERISHELDDRYQKLFELYAERDKLQSELMSDIIKANTIYKQEKDKLFEETIDALDEKLVELEQQVQTYKQSDSEEFQACQKQIGLIKEMQADFKSISAATKKAQELMSRSEKLRPSGIEEVDRLKLGVVLSEVRTKVMHNKIEDSGINGKKIDPLLLRGKQLDAAMGKYAQNTYKIQQGISGLNSGIRDLEMMVDKGSKKLPQVEDLKEAVEELKNSHQFEGAPRLN